jgi:RNA-directed DNA polymerase
VDRRTASSITATQGDEEFLDELRSSVKDRSFCPLPVRERMIPKAGGKLRRLGIPTVADRVVQASLKLVLEPIFEADFLPCSYGFRPKRRAHDAVSDVHYLASKPRNYEWIVEGDIKACFDEISHPALMDRVRVRIADRRVLALVKAFLKAGILSEDRLLQETTVGTRKVGSSHRCWPTWRCRFWTSTSPRLPVAHGPPRRSELDVAVTVCRTTAWCGMRTTGA